MKILALGDVVGEKALAYLAQHLPAQRRALGADLVIVNGDNVSPELIAYAESLGIPVLPKPADEEYYEACNNFYDKVFAQE